MTRKVYWPRGITTMKKLFSFLGLSVFFVFSVYTQNYNPESDFKFIVMNPGSEYAQVHIDKYNGNSKDVSIPPFIQNNPVTVISDRAFWDKQLTSVTIPDSVITIGDWAFMQNQLTSIIIPDSVTTIGSGAFKDNKLTNVAFGANVTSIGSGAFSGNQLVSITIPNKITHIPDGIFSDNKISSVTIPETVTAIGMRAFYGNPLSTVIMRASPVMVYNGAFAIGSEHDRSFNEFYSGNKNRAGTYTYKNGRWSYSAR